MAPRRPVRPSSALRDLLTGEAAGGLALVFAAALALVIANTPLAPAYFAALELPLGPLDLRHWINDGLMAIFFLLVGLELKRELLDGQLATWQRRMLPATAAAAGMAVPAIIYVAINRGEPLAVRGWAVPTATDIAFALGLLALLGSRVPPSIKILLTAIAVIDDLGAIAIIALFYTRELAGLPLLGAAGGLVALIALNRLGVRALWPYLLIGAGVWFGVLHSGIHATLAGVAVAMTIPITRTPGHPDDPASPLHRLEHGLQSWVAYLVLPIFAFANAGLSFAGMSSRAAFAPVPLAVMAGLFLGKQLGVFGASAAMIGTRLVTMPARASWLQLYGMALLCGIGFTMSLFIGGLAFGDGSPLDDAVKIGILAGSLLSGAAGYVVLRIARSEC